MEKLRKNKTYIAIAGNIGSGKTTLTKILAEKLDAVPSYGDNDNPYIEDFYEDMHRWSFNLQIYFLGKRLQQSIGLQNMNENIIQDRTVYEDAYIFADNLHASGLMSTRDFNTYIEIFELSYGLLKTPDLLIYLRADVPTLISQIQKCGRVYEMSIQEDYLAMLNERYDNWINNIYKGKVLIIDIDEKDFILDPSVIDDIILDIKTKISEDE
ncbi:MAG: deoxynucleoside kinase [Rikenellaceae bacterium]|nr:deoxynucleoside kinase [Rikenellaceae bacterium]